MPAPMRMVTWLPELVPSCPGDPCSTPTYTQVADCYKYIIARIPPKSNLLGIFQALMTPFKVKSLDECTHMAALEREFVHARCPELLMSMDILFMRDDFGFHVTPTGVVWVKMYGIWDRGVTQQAG